MPVEGYFCACRGLLLCLYRIIVVHVEGYCCACRGLFFVPVESYFLCL